MTVALSIVAPCYNEEGSLEELYRRTAAAAEGVAGRAFEIVLVNDRSRERTRGSVPAHAASRGAARGPLVRDRARQRRFARPHLGDHARARGPRRARRRDQPLAQ